MNKNRYTEAKRISQGSFYIKKNYIAKKELTFSYMRYRILRPLLKFYYRIFNIFHPKRPWTTPASIIIFEHLLNNNMVGLEYGSGRSTTFFAKRLKHLTSVEHHQNWYAKINSEIDFSTLDNIDYCFVDKNWEKEIHPTPRKWHKKYLLDEDFQQRDEYYNYFQFINKFSDNHFDFILIDGRARVECILNAIDKLKSKGILVLDNSNRDRYSLAIKVLDSWPKVITTNGLFDTTLWFKP